jgi:hypothetical protein
VKAGGGLTAQHRTTSPRLGPVRARLNARMAVAWRAVAAWRSVAAAMCWASVKNGSKWVVAATVGRIGKD